MGVNLSELLVGETIDLDSLNGKVVAIDAFNMLYQFLSSLRGPDGSLMTNSKGVVTSHLIGIMSRTTRLMEKGVKVVFVFDGVAPELKEKERARRRKLKEEAVVAYEEAKDAKDEEAMRKFATRTTSLTPEMVEDAKEVIEALGVPVIQAPSEGEAQAAHMQSKGDVDFVASQDYDTFLFGGEKVVRNLSLLGKRKKVSKLTYETVMPEVVTLSASLNKLGLDREQLIILGILVGTDFNVGGIKGIGPKKGLKLIKDYKDYDQLFLDQKWGDYFDYSWRDVHDIFFNLPVLEDYTLEWKPINEAHLFEVLCDKYEFNKERVKGQLDKILKAQSKLAQKGLGDFF